MKKNVLILHCDQLKADCLGFSGNSFVRTPNIDELAKEGTVFSQHIASASTCMPSRASLLTGLYPPAHGVWINGVPLNRKEYFHPMKKPAFSQWNDMPVLATDDIPTMADIFSDAGYDTIALGKLHLTPNMASTEYGFQESYLAWENNSLNDWNGPYYGFKKVALTCSHGEELAYYGHYAKWLAREYPEISKNAKECAVKAERLVPELDDFYESAIPAEAHNTTWIANQFKDYIDDKSEDKPFFAFLGFPDPHHPFTPSPEIFEMFKDSDVHEISDLDGLGVKGTFTENAAQNVSKLSEKAREDVIRATYAMIYQIDQAIGKIIKTLKEKKLWDNTTIVFTSDHGDYLCDHGLLRKSVYASDTLLRIPCIIRDPDIKQDDFLDYPTSNCDILPTLANLANVKFPDNLHGKNMFDVNDENNAFAYSFTGNAKETGYTVYRENCRFTYYPNAHKGELFDHSKDKGEINNLYKSPEQQKQIDKFKNIIKEELFEKYNPMSARLAHW